MLYRLNRQSQAINFQQAMVIVALSWAIIPLLDTIPFIAIANHFATSPNISQALAHFQSPY